MLNTLRERFPFVKTLPTELNHPLEIAIRPYLSWNLITMDDNVSILITPDTGELKKLINNELLIIEGTAARLWLTQKGLLR